MCNGFITHTSACNGFITSECNESIFWIFLFSRKILKHLAKSWVLHANIFTIYLKAFINEWTFGSKCFKTETKWKSISYNYTNLDQYMTPIETTLILVLMSSWIIWLASIEMKVLLKMLKKVRKIVNWFLINLLVWTPTSPLEPTLMVLLVLVSSCNIWLGSTGQKCFKNWKKLKLISYNSARL